MISDATQYAHYVFNTFKQNSQGQINFEVTLVYFHCDNI